MAFVLKIHADDGGGTEIDLSANVSGYRPTAGPDTDSTVTEAFTWRQLGGTALTTPKNNLRDLSNMFNQAARAQKDRIYPRIWVYFKWDSGDVSYRSPLYGGSITASPRALAKGLLAANATEWDIVWTRGNYWETSSESTATPSTDATDEHYRTWASDNYLYNSQQITEVVDEVLAAGDDATKSFSGTLAHYPVWYQGYKDWYDDDTLNITLTYNVGAGAVNLDYPSTNADVTTFTINRRTGVWALVFATAPISGSNVVLDYSYGTGNTVEFETDKFVDGNGDNDLPCPLRLELTNESSTMDLRSIYLAIGSAQQDAFPVGNLRMDDAAAVGGTQQVDAACTLGYRRDFTVTTTEAKAWTSQAFDFGDTGDGRYYVPMVRFSPTANTTVFDDVLIRWKVIESATAVVLYESEQYRPAPDAKLIQPVGYIMVAPWANMERLADVNYMLEMWCQSVSGSVTLSVDFVQLFPTDSFTRVNVISDAVQENEVLIIDAGLQEAYISNGAGTPIYRKNTEVLYGWPEIKPGYADGGFMYALFVDDTDYTGTIDWPLALVVKYRPRRRLI